MKAESTKKKYYATARGQSLVITNLRVYVWTTTEELKCVSGDDLLHPYSKIISMWEILPQSLS
jgi:hypothetical protein